MPGAQPRGRKMDSELKRRYTDHLEKMPDHDILIGLSTKMDTVCVAHAETREMLQDYIKRSDDRCDRRIGIVYKKVDEKVGRPTYLKILGISVGVIAILFASVSLNWKTCTKNELQISSNAAHIEKNLKAIDKMISR